MATQDIGNIRQILVEDEMRSSYLDYAMSVITARALPDVRDGLKPAQRRILVAMNDLNLAPNRGYRKCAKIAGDTSGNYHPHGEQVVYPTLVRMAQDWVMRYPLVDGQGNFGSIDGDAPAAMRYCVTGDTRVATPSGEVRIDSIVEGARPNSDHGISLDVLDHHGRTVNASRLFHSGDHPTLRLRTLEGYELTGTTNHPILCLGSETPSWKLLDKIRPGHTVLISARAGLERQKKSPQHDIGHANRWEQGGTAILERIESEEAHRAIAPLVTGDFYFAEVESVIDAGIQPVYSLRVDTREHAFITNGFVSHNTEARLTPLAAEILADLEKQTVNYRPNYDETREEPVVLPSVVPNLLINGCSGIAVGMATEVPPHNLGEVCDAIVHVIDHSDATAADLHKIVRGPDFPTGGLIHGHQGIRDCYLNGRGLIKMRARVQVEEGRAGRMSLVATEIPFQVNKSALLEKIADLVKDGKVQGISDLRDESDREGMRIVIELKKDANPKVVLNQLFVHSPLQSTFGAIMLALVDNRPQILNLRQLVDQYLRHRQEVIRRRTEFDLAEAEKRAHILEGLKIALDHLDAVIALIRKAKDVETARAGLIAEFKLTEIQANAILEMRLSRLTGLERKKIEEEYLELIQLIEKLRSILANPKKILAIVRDEISKLKDKYGDARRTEIIHEEGDIDYEDTIEQKDMVITISHAGYVKRQEISSYRSQRRGGKGVIGARTKEEDYIEHLFVAGTHSYLLFLTDKGRCYWLKVHEVEQAGRMARGRPLVNHLEGLSREERVQAVVAVKEFDDKHYLVCATRKGLIKKTVLSAYGNPRRGGINAVLLEEGDALFEAAITDGTQDIILAKRKGLAVRFHEKEVRAMGRTAYGVKAVTLDDAEDEVVGMVGVRRQATLLTVTEHGYGKRSEIGDYRVSHRGGKGIITIKTTDRNGQVVAVKEVVDGDELMIITRQGQLIRMPVKGISVLGRNTQGVRLVNLAAAGEGELLADTVAGVTRVVSEEDQAEGAVGGTNGAPVLDSTSEIAGEGSEEIGEGEE